MKYLGIDSKYKARFWSGAKRANLIHKGIGYIFIAIG